MSLSESFRDLFKRSEDTMEEQEIRVRAWLIIRAEDMEALQGHYGGIRKLDRDSQVVIIRGDITTPAEEVYKLVVPIDVAETAYIPLIEHIKEMVGLQNLEILKVIDHDPKVLQNASGYITPGEFKEGERHPFYELLKPGRQDYSPGYNPWG
jgi:hypothetical protein